MTLHDYQTAAVDRAAAALAAGESLLIVSPTGSGKSYMIAGLLARTPGAVVVVPSIEIAAGIGDKIGIPPDRPSLEAAGIWTAKTLHNRLMDGIIQLPKALIIDEAHHSVDDTHELIRLACGVPAIGFTATAYRGTPAESVKLRKRWPNVYRALTLKEAVARGAISQPHMTVWPLVNDDLIEVANGEFVVESADRALRETLPDVISRCRSLAADGIWKRPTVFCVSSVITADMLVRALTDAGLPAVSVTGGTSPAERQAAFRTIVERRAALVQIKVIGEGVDLPLRVMVDLAPTLSPLFWMQRIGRITRQVGMRCPICASTVPRPDMPGIGRTCPSCMTPNSMVSAEPPQYICTNHNLTRHAYLWEGLIPVNQIKGAQTAWGPEYKPSRRSLARALDLEGFGRFTVSQVPVADGTFMSLYALQTRDGLHQYAVILHPCLPAAFFFQRSNALTGEAGVSREGWTYSKKKYGKWKQIENIPSAEGYVSVKPDTITDRMLAWWKRSAGSVGLAAAYVPNAREFVALPVLSDTRLKFRG